MYTLVARPSMLATARAARHVRRRVSSAAESVTVTISEAEAMTAAALRKIGWDEEDAGLQAKIMTAAELCGNNQGLVKMYNPVLMAPSPNTSKPTIERDTPTSAVVNANQSPGMLAAVTAADLAVKKVKESPGPIAIVSAYNAGTSSGQLAFYTGRIAEQGLIGIAMANSPEWVAAAPGGKGASAQPPGSNARARRSSLGPRRSTLVCARRSSLRPRRPTHVCARRRERRLCRCLVPTQSPLVSQTPAGRR